MTNSNIFKSFKRNYKAILSSVLVVAMLVVGVNWPDFTPKADIISDLDLKYITTDLDRPYTVLTAEIEGSLNDVSYYLYQANAPIYFFSDLNSIGVRAYESEVATGQVSVTKYSYNLGLKTWELKETQTIGNSTKISNVGTTPSYGSFVDNKSFYSIGSIAGDYGVMDAIDEFGLSTYVPSNYGEYIIGYCGEQTSTTYEYNGSTVVEGSDILNKNFINYEKFENASVMPKYSLNSSVEYQDENMALSNFYRSVNLFNSSSDAGIFYYNNGMDDSIYLSSGQMQFDFSKFNSAAQYNETGILDENILLPDTYRNEYNYTEMNIDFYANEDNVQVDYVANDSGLITNSTITYENVTVPNTTGSRTSNAICYTINNNHKVYLFVDNYDSKKIESIKVERTSDATDYEAFALKIPMIMSVNINGETVRVGRYFYLVLKESTESNGNNAYETVLNAVNAKNTDTDFINRLMVYTNYSDFDYASTYTSVNNGTTYKVNDNFLDGTNYNKDVYLKAYSSSTDTIYGDVNNGFENIIDISNGVTTYILSGQLMGYLPEKQTTGIDFRLSLAQGDIDSSKSKLYVDSSGTSIYYAESATSSDRLELVNVEYSTAYSSLKLKADNITQYRLKMKDVNAFSGFGISAKVYDGQKDITKDISFKLSKDNTSLVEMYLDSMSDISFKENWKPIEVEDLVTSLPIENRYPALPNSKTEMNSPFATLINYGEYQLLVYTDVKPTYNGSGLSFKEDVSVEIWRYYNKLWIFENYTEKVSDATISLPYKAGLNSIDYINYDLENAGKVIMSANETYDDGSPKLRTIKIPQLASSDSNQYIFVNNSIGYYAFTSSTDKITANGNNEVIVPEGQWYALVQNTWVKVSNTAALNNNWVYQTGDLFTIDRTTFDTNLKYTNDNNSAWVNAEGFSNSNWSDNVDYFRYIPIYLATSGYEYIIYEVSGGFESIEYNPSTTGDITITEDGISFANPLTLNPSNSGYNDVIVKRFTTSWQVQTDVKNDFANINGTFIYSKPNALNSIIYTSKDIYGTTVDGTSKVVLSNLFSQSLIVSDALATSDLSCVSPVDSSGAIIIDGNPFEYVILTQELIDNNTTYVAYISNQQFKYSTAGDTIDILSDEYPVKIYKEYWDLNTNSWTSPELLYDMDKENGTIDTFTKTYTEMSNNTGASTVVAYYNQYPNGRVVKLDTTLTNKTEGHFILKLMNDSSSSPLPENAYEVYYDSAGTEHLGKWTWKWSDNGPEVDYYYTPEGVRVTDTSKTHRYYKIVQFEAGGNVNEFVAAGEYIDFIGSKISMGTKDVKGNWITDNGIVVLPNGSYGYYDIDLELTSSRPAGIYYFAVEENGKIVSNEAAIDDSTTEDIKNRILNICSSDNIKWINKTIEAYEDVSIDYERYADVTFLDSSIDAILGDFVNPENISELEYIQPKDSVENYWITFVDSIANIYSPFLNTANSQGKVAMDIQSYMLFFPNFGNVERVLTGLITKDGIAFDISGFNPNNIAKSDSFWYTDSASSDDFIAPMIKAVYMLNHTFKIDAEDPGAYQTIFDNEGNVIYRPYEFKDVNIKYQYVPDKEYNNSLIKDNKDDDGISYYLTENNKHYKILDNNNSIVVSYNLDNGQTVESSNGGYSFLYNEALVEDGFVNTEFSTVGDLIIPKSIEKNDTWYSLAEDYYLVDGKLYRSVDSNQFYDERISVVENTVRDNYYLTEVVSDTVIDTEHGEARNITNDGFDYYFNGQFISNIPINKIFYYENNGETWGILYSKAEVEQDIYDENGEIIEDENGNPLTPTVIKNVVQVMVYEQVTSYKYVVNAEYISQNYTFTRLLKALSDEDISNITSDNNSSWSELVSTKDSKGLNQYLDTSNTLWNGKNIETISGTTIGSDGYLYKGGEKVSAEAEYDENGNQIEYDVTGVEYYYITIEKDFRTDIAFSYDDGTGNIVSFQEGDLVSSIDENGNKRTIVLDSNSFAFPVDIETGTITLNAYVLDGAGNKSTSISGPWVLSRNDLAATKDWNEYFVAGTATDDIILEIMSAISANTTDTKAPEITGVFLYKGSLYIVANDPDDEETGAKASGIGIAGTYNYLFKHTSFENTEGSTLKNLKYYAMSGGSLAIEAGTPFSTLVNFDLGQYNAYLETFKDADGKIETAELDLSAFDIARNQSSIVHVGISEENNNSVLYGKVSQTIYEMLLAAREENGDGDNIAPIITAIYTLDGILYVEATDNLGIKSYGYKWSLDSTMAADTTGLDDYGNEISIKAGDDIPKGTIIWHGAAQQPVTVPTKMVIYVEDNAGNAAYETIVISASNQLIFGTVDDETMDEIYGEDAEKPSNSAPVITNVYTYKGHLYFEGFDAENNLATWCYGFKPLDNMVLNSDYVGYNASFQQINIPAGDTIKANQLIYKRVNSQEINIPMNITISLRDSLGLEAQQTFYIFKDNYVYQGEAPEDISGEIENPDGSDNPIDPDNPDNPVNPDEPIDPEKPIPVPPDIEGVDWELYDYLFEILDNETNRVVYSIRLDEAAEIDCPRLENSVLYKYNISVISEEDDSVLTSTSGKIRMTDTIAPIITKIWYSKNRVYVSAYDLGGFGDTPYSFMIEGSRDTTEKYISNNNTVVLSGETINIKVKDAAGNVATATVDINEKTKDILYESLNPKDYVYINSNESKSLAYWYAYINTTYGIDVSDSYLSDKNKSENISFEIKNNNVYLDFVGDGVITFYDNKTSKYLALNLRTLNTGKSYKSIVIQTGSELDVSLAFKNKLLEQFGTYDGLSWYADGEVLSRMGSTVAANKPGVGTIKFVYNNKELDVYVLVVDSIKNTVSSCDFGKENFAYTYLSKDRVDIATALRLAGSSEANNIVLSDATTGVSREDNSIVFSSVGVKALNLIDCVNDNLGEIKFEVIAITPYISTFTDIIGSNARADIEVLCEKGFIGEYPDNKYKPSNKMTTKEFLTMLNKVKLTYDTDFEVNKVLTNLNLSEKDFDYYSSQNILINMTQDEVDKTIGTYTLNKAITFEEVVKLISATILYDDYHNETGITAPDGLSNCSQEAIHLISMGIISSDDTRNGTRELTRAEIAYILTKTIKYLDL